MRTPVFTCKKQQTAALLTLAQSMVGGKQRTVVWPGFVLLFVTWQEPVLRVTVIEGEIMTAGVGVAGTSLAGAQNLRTACNCPLIKKGKSALHVNWVCYIFTSSVSFYESTIVHEITSPCSQLYNIEIVMNNTDGLDSILLIFEFFWVVPSCNTCENEWLLSSFSEGRFVSRKCIAKDGTGYDSMISKISVT